MRTSGRGFTLIELLVVIAIIGLLSSVVLASLNSARSKSRIVAAQATLKEFQKASFLLEADTGVTIGGYAISIPGTNVAARCPSSGGNKDFALDGSTSGWPASSVGLIVGGGSFPGWRGPYIPTVPPDPWGNPYYFDDDFGCRAGATGCDGFPTTGIALRAIHSGGPNGSGENIYDADNVVLVLCQR